MKTLFLLRHAKADRDILFIRDIERPLSERGYGDALLVSSVLKEQQIIPEKIISSPAVRAYSTALIFAGTFGIEPNAITIEKNLYDSSPSDYLGVIRGLDDRHSSCLVAGHNDVISDVARALSGGEALGPMKTCGLIMLTAEIDSWKNIPGGSCKLALSLFPALLREA